ncbi:hypothetical protein BDA96_02G445600 [Sorghum bicolor]|uniref:Telomeric single stranded DNA binding POT1/Cdc13 domain-containing protein n=1 Tax=Sorghum bicolor TaxID=4558 RepID=A0A921UWG7_SORBI|nr:protection of telomeres protein 1b isoform X2 [Sorghum bicolor]KAG0546418.1 hypothetical protein BDA96_02G445600 [Sorghum bicolor]|eukprot:XP_021309724.1 protection of telomeres protein 1b isoform X2 [Sorghum bicolor]
MEDEASSSARKPKRPRVAPAAAAAAAAWEPHFTYLPIADALKQRPRARVCLFAVVAEIGAAFHSSGTDFTVTLRIVDESRKAGISATFFAQEPDLLPCVKSNGDVISLRDVMVKCYLEEFFIAVDKRLSSFALFESKVSAECSPYQTSKNYHGSKHDKERLTQLRTWLPLGLKDFGLKDLELQLRSLKSDSTFDLVCKVLHVLKHKDKWIFYVWDGTDTPAAEFQAISDAEAVASPALPRELLCTMPCIGTVLRIFSDRPVNKASHMQQGTYWARFCNITCKREFGIWKGVFLKRSRVRLLSHEDGSVVDRLKMYDSRNANKVLHQPMGSFPSNVADEYEEEGYSTLMESLTHPEVTHKVKTLVRVVAFYPCEAYELHLLLRSNYDYSIRLTLEDPTARIDAYVHKQNLVQFFGDSLTEVVVMKKLNKLLGIPESEDGDEVVPMSWNSPWIWCVMSSYYCEKTDPWGSRRYRIVDTTIRD